MSKSFFITLVVNYAAGSSEEKLKLEKLDLSICLQTSCLGPNIMTLVLSEINLGVHF